MTNDDSFRSATSSFAPWRPPRAFPGKLHQQPRADHSPRRCFDQHRSTTCWAKIGILKLPLILQRSTKHQSMAAANDTQILDVLGASKRLRCCTSLGNLELEPSMPCSSFRRQACVSRGWGRWIIRMAMDGEMKAGIVHVHSFKVLINAVLTSRHWKGLFGNWVVHPQTEDPNSEPHVITEQTMTSLTLLSHRTPSTNRHGPWLTLW